MNKDDVETADSLLQIFHYFRIELIVFMDDDDKRSHVAATLTLAKAQIDASRMIKDGRK